MEHQQRLAQVGEAFVELLLGDVVEEFALIGTAARRATLPPRPFLDLSTCCLNRPVTCAGSAGAAMVTTARASGMRCAAARAPPRRRGCGRSGSRARCASCADGRRRRPGRRHWRKNVVLANSPSLAPRPVKSKRSTAMPCAGQPLGDALGREVVLAAGEAMREQREGRRLAERPIERRRELLARGVGEGEAFAAHGYLVTVLARVLVQTNGIPRATHGVKFA